jgi:8-oxo-dGTP pyrophosphatase MutT (NUDIX family)
MSDQWPKITSRKIIKISQWMDVMAREVEFAKGEAPQVYHAVSQLDYLAIVAVTPDGRIPIVHQYRPAVEAFTWELPAGLLEQGEDPAKGSSRELLEETGYPTRKAHILGSAAACTGRLNNQVHTIFIETGEAISDFRPEPGLTVALKTPAELDAMIRSGEFVQQLHLGALMLAELKGLLVLPR